MAARTSDQDGRSATAAEHGSRRDDSAEVSFGPALFMTSIKGRAPGTGGRLRWVFTGVWLAYLVEPVSALFGGRHGAAWRAGGIVLAVTFAVVYLLLVVAATRLPRSRAAAGLTTLILLTCVACAVFGPAWTPLWIYVSAATGLIVGGPFRRRVSIAVILAVAAAYSLSAWADHVGWSDYAVILLPTVLTGLAMIGFRMQMTLMAELAQARGAVAKLAKNEERLRLARDMHDLTGQSLSMITLKSELAAKRLRRLPPGPERDAALGDLGDISQVSRQTLHDIREAVSGYRRPTLAIEVITARNALEAAGVTFDDHAELTIRSGTFEAEAEAALAWCLREAVTNVIRHSGARNCRVRLRRQPGELSLEVADDGRGPGSPGPVPDGDPADGSGLHGMSERLSAIGGRLALGTPRGTSGGFCLTATVPYAGSGDNDGS